MTSWFETLIASIFALAAATAGAIVVFCHRPKTTAVPAPAAGPNKPLGIIRVQRIEATETPRKTNAYDDVANVEELLEGVPFVKVAPENGWEKKRIWTRSVRVWLNEEDATQGFKNLVWGEMALVETITDVSLLHPDRGPYARHELQMTESTKQKEPRHVYALRAFREQDFADKLFKQALSQCPQ